jgi:hypothetical protein
VADDKAKTAKFPGTPWGPFAKDPSLLPLLDVTGPAWDRAVEKAREVRLMLQRSDESLKRLQKVWEEEHAQLKESAEKGSNRTR